MNNSNNNHIFDIYNIEEQLHEDGYKRICGCDEAGRGPMAGPLVVAGCILPEGLKIPYLNDSKKVSPKKREELFNYIKDVAISYHIEIISVSDVDRMDVYHASQIGMETIINKLDCDYALTDAMKVDVNIPYMSIIKGDSKSASIAAASILAKVTRDHYMEELDKEGQASQRNPMTKVYKIVDGLKEYLE